MRKIGRKGDASDPLIFLVVIFFLAVAFIATIFVNTQMAEIVSTSKLNESAAFSSIDSAFDNINKNAVDRGFALIFTLMIIFVFASGFLVRIHPIFLFIYIFFLAISIFTAVFIGNTYVKLQENPTLATITQEATMTSWIMNHIVIITLAIGIISMILVFSKIFSAPTGIGSDGGDIL